MAESLAWRITRYLIGIGAIATIGLCVYLGFTDHNTIGGGAFLSLYCFWLAMAAFRKKQVQIPIGIGFIGLGLSSLLVVPMLPHHPVISVLGICALGIFIVLSNRAGLIVSLIAIAVGFIIPTKINTIISFIVAIPLLLLCAPLLLGFFAFMGRKSPNPSFSAPTRYFNFSGHAQTCPGCGGGFARSTCSHCSGSGYI